MNKGKKLYEGKAKIIYEGPEKGTAIQHFKDDATAFNNQKKSTVEGKGVLNNRISEHILNNINQIGIPTHLIKRINMREQLIKLAEIIPIEFIVRNIATGSLTKRLGIPDGTVLSKPLIEYSYKNDELGDPLVAKEHILEFNWAKATELDLIKNHWICDREDRSNKSKITITLVMLHLKMVVEDKVVVLEVLAVQIFQIFLKIFLEILGVVEDQEIEAPTIEVQI